MKKSLLVMTSALLLGLTLGSCAPSVANPFTGYNDPAKLTWNKVSNMYELTFDTGGSPASRVNLYIAGDNVSISKNLLDSKTCFPYKDASGVITAYGCKFDTVSTKAIVFVTGTDLTANVTYRRAGWTTSRFLYAK